MTRVLLCDDQALVRVGLRKIVESEDDLEVVGEAGDGEDAVTATIALHPDVVLMDIRMPVLDGIEATRRIVHARPATRVVILTTFGLDGYVYDALCVGASGFMLKDAPPEEIVAAVRIAANGEALLAPSITRAVIEEFARRIPNEAPSPRPRPPALDELTPREHEVLQLLARGLSNPEICERLVVSEATTKTHVARILQKLGLRDRIQAVIYAYESGLIQPGGEQLNVDITATDYHTAGEPFRIVAGGLPEIPGETVRDRREHASQSPDVEHIRRLLCHEPRGHADMYGGFLVPPDDAGAAFGVLFWHKDGYSTACGHGTIALGAWAVESGRVAAPRDGDVDVPIDVPSGRVVARVRRANGDVASVAFHNVPAFAVARDVAVDDVTVDIAYGGALYAFLPAAALGLRVVPDDLAALIAAGRRIKRGLSDTDIYGTVFHEQLGPRHFRNVAIFADGEVDRSPTGSATSARTALLLADGVISEGEDWRNDSIIGTGFDARAVGTHPDGVLTEVEGTAFRTGEHRFVLDPRDTLGTGFVLR